MKKIIICLLIIVLILSVTIFLRKCNDGKEISQGIINNEQESEIKEYSLEELEIMALNYYEKKNDYRPGSVGSQIHSENINLVDIQLYDNFEGHNSTCDWYTVNKFTAEGTNILGEKINLKD